MKSQDLDEPDYGEGNLEWTRKLLEKWGAEWTPEGWVAEDLYLRNLDFIRLPLIKSVSRDFDCSYNNLTSLEEAPIEVGGQFDCYNNQLTTLEGAPEFVGVSFSCQNNQLTSLEGSPEKVGMSFFCYNNPGNFIEEDVKVVSRVYGEIKV